MRPPTPGDYILLRQPDNPPWPALVCTDDMAPQEVAACRPNGYLTLALLIKRKSEFRYIMSTDMREFDPFIQHEHSQDDELRYAYDQVLNAMDFVGSSLDYWRRAIEDQQKSSHLPTPTPSNSSGYTETESDDEYLKEAKRLSLAEHRSRNNTELSTSSPPPLEKLTHTTIVPNPFCARGLGDLPNQFHPTVECNSVNSSKRVSKRPHIEDSDIVEGDISDSREFVTFLIGKEREPFFIPLAEVQKRPYLSNDKIGCLTTMEDGTYRINLPCLEEFHRDDFGFVADFLQTGRFGYSVIDDENRREALAQCAAAWEIGDRLGMEDLLEHIAEKLEQLRPWELEDAFIFATIVYMTPDALLDGHERVKRLLTDFLAENFYDLARKHGDSFTYRLQKVPELERDIHLKMVELAEQKMSMDVG
ncbi:hypothetical protein N0V90_000527 [Kalmusia sp. IMI 367209]|nr:hypothetical protein N0V90_000527 [Kalmusia sp. IMI 367209]